ncbi:MAG: glycosyltransferase family 4 protein [Acidobacteriaceae bacterium]|nr:glycosyltransferase family 4 protein [Acidobacteriaceae bacterium]
MRIALDATYSVDAQPSGIAVYSRELLDGLSSIYPQDDFVRCYRIKQFFRSPKPGARNVKRRILWPRFNVFGADVFHALNQRVDQREAPRVVSTFHDLFVISGEYSKPEFRKRFAQQARRAAEQSDLIIAVSEFTADQVSSLLNVERGRIRVIAHGVHSPLPTQERAREKVVLFVGALQARKNVERLLEAFQSLPATWRLVLAGAPSGYRASEILDRIEASRSRERIEVTGYVSRERLDDLYTRASIFAFPSLDEGFGIPVLEAMAWGIPVITSNGSALAELGRGVALLVDPRQVGEIANALINLAENEDLREKLIRAGQLRAAEFTWEKAIRRTYQVYRELSS